MKEARAPRCLQVIALCSLFLCVAVPMFSSPGLAGPCSAVQGAELTDFVPPLLSYSSVFQHYHGYQDQEVASWLEANETVGRVGGWRYYLEEAAQSQQEPIPLTEDARHHSGHGGKP